MLRNFLVGLLWCGLMGAAQAEEAAVPLASVVVDVYQLRHWGERKYDVYLADTRKYHYDDVAVTERELQFIGTHPFSTQVNDEGVVLRQ